MQRDRGERVPAELKNNSRKPVLLGLVRVRGDGKLDDVRKIKVQASRASLVIVRVRLQLKKEWRAFCRIWIRQVILPESESVKVAQSCPALRPHGLYIP